MMEEYCHFMDLSPSAVEDKFSSSNDFLWATDEGLNEVKKGQLCGASEEIDSLCLNFGLFPNDPSEEEQGFLLSAYQQKDHQQPSYEPLDNLRFDMVSSPLQIQVAGIMQFHENFPTKVPIFYPAKNKQYPTPLAPVEILNHYGKGFKRLCNEGKILHPLDDSAAMITNDDGRKLSIEDVMKVAGTRFIQSSSESPGLDLLVTHPFGFSFSEFSGEEKEDVALVESLLSCAEKVGYKQFERASKLLANCKSFSSKTESPVKRVVHYFAEALHHRIDKETGRLSPKDIEEMQKFDPEELTKSLNPTTHLFYEMLPFCQISMFTAVQAIIENVTEAKKIHLIDLEIRKGAQWTTLMHALDSRHDCPLELLKITAIGSGTTSKDDIEDTGERLKDFAQSLNIPFSFNVVMVSDMLCEDLLEIDPEETIAVYSQFAITSKIQQPDQLETIMRVVRTIRPVVMVVAEIEANHNSTSFVKRFIEALFYFSAFFDCLEACMKQDEQSRMAIESLLGHGIRNIVASEGAERKSRNVTIDVWRAFFSRYGIVETELSMLSLYQAELVAKRFPCGSCCTFHMNGQCLLVGWKGTPINSVSVWKFD